MRPSLLLLLACAPGIFGCTQPLAPDSAATPVPVVRLLFTSYSGLIEPQRLVVRDPAAWAEVWTAIWRSHSPLPELPQVDFAREMLVVVALGARPNGGYGILVDSAIATADDVDVWIRAISPGPSCVVTTAVSQPVDIARLPRSDGVLRFHDRTEERACQ
jgi:protease stability complex PrcB-like protein